MKRLFLAIVILWLQQSAAQPVPEGMREGINYLAGDTSVILNLFAPGKDHVSVTGDFNDWSIVPLHKMNRTPDGKHFWLRINGLSPGVEYGYQFVIDDSIRVADYYTEKVLDPVHDAELKSVYPGLKPYPSGKTTGLVSVLQTGAPEYVWKNTYFKKPDKHNLVIYELLIRDFLATHDYRSLIDTLPYLQNLGINAVELMPVNEFEGNSSWGYNTSFYFAPDKYYGTANQLKEFVDSCHSRGIAVIMDIVLNHSFNQSPMVRMYFDEVNQRPSANNPWFNQVQPHAFGFGSDFNHESEVTRYFVDRVTKFWLEEYKFDGYRFDFTKGFTQRSSADNAQFSAYDQSRIDILTRINDSIRSGFPDAYVILEHLADNSEEKVLAASGMMLWGNMNYSFNEATMGYMDNNKSDFSGAFYAERGFTEPYLIAYMESHDEERLMFKNLSFGNVSSPAHQVTDLTVALARTEMATALYLMIPGPKMIWQFGELGYDRSIFMCADSSLPLPYPRDSCKLDEKPPVWHYASDPRRRKIYDRMASLLRLRKAFPAVFSQPDVRYAVQGAFKTIQLLHADLSVTAIANFDVKPVRGEAPFANPGKWYNYLTGKSVNITGTVRSFTLAPGTYRIYVSKQVRNRSRRISRQ